MVANGIPWDTMGYHDPQKVWKQWGHGAIWAYKVVPQFRIAKLVQITPRSLWFMVDISRLTNYSKLSLFITPRSLWFMVDISRLTNYC